ncbi:EscU/YscU/HrcU family type III secretion system export apparatus switch protein [Paracoccus alkanivorans]|uniref:EscU/YscU/HrcU family type III secretion system export apparatus switch protein n=1 Tax=Paracoccus alkanivorans TaxID=2116655 RepID=A0A3M0MAX6_9RHOB|nr:EscU/YscU/HrcU family type III secretion system export apparatus switch protein [Paracoccus alkanivorans]RMC34948.1 hypothetical protein C9E81_12730 [Paracoccus alkanivorans]
MSNESSEEKNLPPSQHKLRKAREKGQVVTSRESLTSVTTALVLIYLFMRRETIGADLQALFTIPADPAMNFTTELAGKARDSLELVLRLLLPILIGVIAVAVLGGMTISGGPVFSTHPLIPDFNKLNPASGFKKILGRRALMGFLMHVLRLVALIVVPGLLLWQQLGILIAAPPCGMSCAGGAIHAMIIPVLGAILALLILAALFDYLVQRAGFMREQRMSITEFKREMKDQDGDPLLKGQMRSDQRAMVERPTGLAQATVIIHAASDLAIGLRYVEGDTPAPLIVLRAQGRASVSRLLRGAKVPVNDAASAVALIAKIPVGDYVVDDEHIQAIAPYLRALHTR